MQRSLLRSPVDCIEMVPIAPTVRAYRWPKPERRIPMALAED